jgi:hypothetical protein
MVRIRRCYHQCIQEGAGCAVYLFPPCLPPETGPVFTVAFGGTTATFPMSADDEGVGWFFGLGFLGLEVLLAVLALLGGALFADGSAIFLLVVERSCRAVVKPRSSPARTLVQV